MVNGLTQLSPNTLLAVIYSTQAHSLEVANPEAIELPPQQDNAIKNDEQMDANVIINAYSSRISSLESVAVSTNALSTSVNRQKLATTNDNSRCISQENTPKIRHFSAVDEVHLEYVHDSDGELGPFYDAAD